MDLTTNVSTNRDSGWVHPHPTAIAVGTDILFELECRPDLYGGY